MKSAAVYTDRQALQYVFLRIIYCSFIKCGELKLENTLAKKLMRMKKIWKQIGRKS